MDDASPARGAPRPLLVWPLAAIVVVAVAALVVGMRTAPPPTLEQRTDAVARTIRCPACGNLSVADATSSLAVQIRSSIRAQLAAGRTAEQIRAALVRSYGSWIVLEPPGHGFGLVAWLAPLAVVVAGIGLLIPVVRRSRPGAAP